MSPFHGVIVLCSQTQIVSATCDRGVRVNCCYYYYYFNPLEKAVC